MNETSQRLREGWPTLILVWAMLLVASTAVYQADLIDGMQVLPIVATFALFFGWLLAKSHFSDRAAHLFALVYGLFFVFYFVGTTLGGDLTWRERVIDLVARQAAWLQKAFNGGTSRDGIIFVMQTAVVFWLLGYLSAWYTFRKPHVWRVVIPTGIVLLSVVYYYNGPRPLLLYLALYTVLALIYVTITHLSSEEWRWRRQSVRYDKSIRFDFMRSGLLAALLALLIAWSLPTMKASAAMTDSLASASTPWRSFQDTWTRLFSSLRSYGSSSSDPYQDTLVLGGPRTVGNTLVMDVQVPEDLPYGVYWQAISYDTYENGRWTASREGMDSTLHYPDDGFLNVPPTEAREVITQTVTNYLPNSSYLYAAPEVVGTNRQMFVDASVDDGGDLLVKSLRSRFLLRQGDSYQVVSRVSMADASSLRGAGTEYPQWVTDHYLQLPETITPRTLDLASNLTANYGNPFDKALAVRDYLRGNITYNDQIAAPPDGTEPVDYVLFDLKEGYCNYYASAMTVMLRSQGIPARVVSGYALGEYDPAGRSYRVRAENLHTWVEVYFPIYGWIQFEPTAAIPVFDRPESSGGGDAFAGETAQADPQSRDDLLPPEDLNGFERADNLGVPDVPQREGLLGNIATWQAALALLTLLAAAVALFFAARYNQSIESDVDRSFGRLGEWARRMGIFWRPNQTPYEQAELLVAAVPEGQQPIRNLTRQYVRKRFSPAQSVEDGFDPTAEWRSLRPTLLKQSLTHWLNRSNRRK